MPVMLQVVPGVGHGTILTTQTRTMRTGEQKSSSICMMDSSSTHSAQNPGQQAVKLFAGNADFCILTSFRLDVLADTAEVASQLRADDQPFPFSHHRDRLQNAAEAFGWQFVANRLSGASGLRLLVGEVTNCISSKALSIPISLKVRLTVSRDCDIGCDYTELQLPPWDRLGDGMYLPENLAIDTKVPRSCKVVVDSQPTVPSLFTTHKTTARDPYSSARERAGISKTTPEAGEVLLLNGRSDVMEASLSTPYFFREGRWVTPPLSSGGNDGVTRRVALATHLCVEKEVHLDSIRDGEAVWISNGVRGFIKGILEMRN